MCALPVWTFSTACLFYMLTNTKVVKGTVNRGNFERRGNFEHRSIFPFNDLYYENRRVYQKLYFSLVVPFIVTISTTVKCKYKLKLWSQKSKTWHMFFHFLNCCKTSVWQHPMLWYPYAMVYHITKLIWYPTLWHSPII